MATQIPKLITNVEPYFRYEGEANATTQDQFQGFLKNEHSVLAVLVKNIWQPTTAYEIGDIIKSPNMPKGFHAIAQTKGNSGANEPTWGDGTTNVSDGTVSWKLSKGDITVNGVGADSNGNIQINNITNATHANNADLATKATNADNATKAIKDNKNQTIDTTYIKDISSDNRGMIFTKGNGVENVIRLGSKSLGNITVTGSNLPERTAVGTATGGFDTTTGGGNIPSYESKVVRGIVAGTYSLQSLLQNLVDNSHKHATFRENSNCNCNCNCDCGDDSGGP